MHPQTPCVLAALCMLSSGCATPELWRWSQKMPAPEVVAVGVANDGETDRLLFELCGVKGVVDGSYELRLSREWMGRDTKRDERRLDVTITPALELEWMRFASRRATRLPAHRLRRPGWIRHPEDLEALRSEPAYAFHLSRAYRSDPRRTLRIYGRSEAVDDWVLLAQTDLHRRDSPRCRRTFAIATMPFALAVDAAAAVISLPVAPIVATNVLLAIH